MVERPRERLLTTKRSVPITCRVPAPDPKARSQGVTNDTESDDGNPLRPRTKSRHYCSFRCDQNRYDRLTQRRHE